jgi:hypothetical protein
VRLIFGAALLLGATVGACAAVSGLNDYSPADGDGSARETEDSGSGLGDDGQAADEPEGSPGTGPSTDSGPGDEAVVTPPITDSGRDGPLSCGPTSCSGCCDPSGICHGGASVDTCGKAGAACADCTNNGGSCNSGTCGAAPKDASTSYQCTSTNVTACTSCSAVLYTSCCKSDHTCGCQWTGFAPCG